MHPKGGTVVAGGSVMTNRHRATRILLSLVLAGCAPSLPSAVAAGDVATVQDYLARGDDVNARDSAGATPLLAAAATGRADLARLLMRKGAKVNARAYADRGPTPLAAAAANQHLELARLLLEKGADVDSSTDVDPALGGWLSGMRDDVVPAILLDWIGGRNGWTPLMLAAFHGDHDLAALLTDKGADVNAQNRHRLTPWMLALYQPMGSGPAWDKRYRDTAKLLLGKGAATPDGRAVVVFRNGAFFTDGSNSSWMIGGPKPSWAVDEIRAGALNQILVAAFTEGAGAKRLQVFYRDVDIVGAGGTLAELTTTGEPRMLEFDASAGGIYCVDYDLGGGTWTPRIDKYR
jgi:hypothetical protein